MSLQAQVAGHSTKPNVPVLFNFNGNDRIVRDLGRDFEKQMRKLLRLAQLAGTFNVTATTPVKGRPHTKGLMVGTPNGKHRSVEITWQEGSNDSRYSLFIATPHGMDPFEFHKRLKGAYENFDPNEEEHVAPSGGQAAMQVKDHIGSRGNVTSIDFGTPRPVDTAPADAAPSVELVDDPTLVETFMRESYRWVNLRNDLSCVSREACLLILKQQCDVVNPEKALNRLVEMKHLYDAGVDGLLAMSTEWLDRIRGISGGGKADTAPAPRPAPTPASEIPSKPDAFGEAAARAASAASAPTQAGVDATVAAQPVPPRKSTTTKSTGSDMTNALADLEKKAATAIELRNRLKEVDSEIENIQGLLEKANERRTRIVKSLDRPDIKAAEERYNQVKALLGK